MEEAGKHSINYRSVNIHVTSVLGNQQGNRGSCPPANAMALFSTAGQGQVRVTVSVCDTRKCPRRKGHMYQCISSISEGMLPRCRRKVMG